MDDIKREGGIVSACHRHGVSVTAKGMPDRRSAKGKVLYERIIEY